MEKNVRTERVTLKTANILVSCWQWSIRKKEIVSKEEKGVIAEPKSFNRVGSSLQVEVLSLIGAERVDPL